MCEILDKVENRGYAKGYAEGYAEYYAEGYAEGIEIGYLSVIRNLMSGLDLSAEMAMDILEISESDRPKYADRILQSPNLTTISKQQTPQ